MKKIIITFIAIAFVADGCGHTNNKNVTQNNDNDWKPFGYEIDGDTEEVISADDDTVNETGYQDKFVKTIGAYDFTELGLAIYEDDLNTAKKLIEAGASKSSCLSDEIFVYDVLYTSVMFGKIKFVEYFTNAEEGVNKVYDENGTTVLTFACKSDEPETSFRISQLLLDAGADVNGGGDMGFDYIFYPLFEAVKKNNLRLVKFLVEKGADITVVDKQGATVFTIIDGLGVNSEMKNYIGQLYK